MFSTKKTLPVRTARTNPQKSSILTDQRQVVILFREGLQVWKIAASPGDLDEIWESIIPDYSRPGAMACASAASSTTGSGGSASSSGSSVPMLKNVGEINEISLGCGP